MADAVAPGQRPEYAGPVVGLDASGAITGNVRRTGGSQGSADGMARSIAELPAAFQCVFEGRFRYFNALQSDLFALAFNTATSLVVSAPTGSASCWSMRCTSCTTSAGGAWRP